MEIKEKKIFQKKKKDYLIQIHAEDEEDEFTSVTMTFCEDFIDFYIRLIIVFSSAENKQLRYLQFFAK